MTYTDYKDATALANAIKKGEITPLQAVEAAVEEVTQHNDDLKALVYLREEEALQEASELTDLNKPFSGVPIVLKDLGHNLKGMPAATGSKMFKDNISESTPNFTQSFLDQGFIVIGQSQVPEFGMVTYSHNETFGTSKNPINTTYTPGGSSGGAAAAIQSGMVHVATASDGGGSIRVPASYTGLIGLKPTRGRTSVGPGKWRSWAGAAVGLALTRSMRDTEKLLLAVQDNKLANPFNIEKLNAENMEEAKAKVKALRIAYSTEAPLGYEISEEAVNAVQKTVGFLKDQGFSVHEAQPNIDYDKLYREYYKVTSVETAVTFAGAEKTLGRPVSKEDVELPNYVVGKYGELLSGVDYTTALQAWDLATEEMMSFHEEYDIFITPTTSKTAPRNDTVYHNDDLLERMEQADNLDKDSLGKLNWEMFSKSLSYTSFVQLHNITGAPAISLPLYTAENGLPLGVQLVAPKAREDWLIALGSLFENNNQFQYYR